MTPATSTQLTREQWEAIGNERFGRNQDKWRFVCPICKNEMSVERARSDFANDLQTLRERDYRIEQECVGRHLPRVGCDWAAYGLFRGPVFVDGVPVFDFATATQETST